jgi:hypothetical protein
LPVTVTVAGTPSGVGEVEDEGGPPPHAFTESNNAAANANIGARIPVISAQPAKFMGSPF